MFALIGAVGVTSVANAQTASAACADNVYSYNLTVQTCVKYIQALSNQVYANNSNILGTRTPLVVDGKFGSKTQSAITNIQAHSSVTIKDTWQTVLLTKDGIVGRQTWAILCTYSSDYSTYSAAGCLNSNFVFKAYDYYAGTGMSSVAH